MTPMFIPKNFFIFSTIHYFSKVQLDCEKFLLEISEILLLHINLEFIDKLIII